LWIFLVEVELTELLPDVWYSRRLDSFFRVMYRILVSSLAYVYSACKGPRTISNIQPDVHLLHSLALVDIPARCNPVDYCADAD
jgi:hypothetical protein